MTTALTPSEHDTLATALTAARSGGASLHQLMIAHQISERTQTAHTTAELRQHIRSMIPEKRFHITAVRSIGLGIVSGIITHYLLRRHT